ncbi:hypothetical protein BDF22DRAFT_741582 [Syncephalis plumigaleata]|nr:hypothetical protein BDF22DRAFT_741582 [Syncephalis plumigaleata]
MSNQVACLIAGALFATGWWIWLDVWIVGRIQHPDSPRISGWSCLPGVLSSIALLWINMIPGELLQRDAYIAADEEMARARCAILTAFTAGFSGLLTALWWWLTDVFNNDNANNQHYGNIPWNDALLSATSKGSIPWSHHNPDIYNDDNVNHGLELQVGWVVLIQNALIFISTFILRFGRSEPDF